MRRAKLAAVLIVAAVAAYVSYWHMHDLALSVGEGSVQAKILPLSVDGMMLAATLTAVERRRDRTPVGIWCWVGLALGLAASTAANIAAAEPTVEGRLVAMWPPLALFVCLELLFTDKHTEPRRRKTKTSTAKAEPEATNGPAPKPAGKSRQKTKQANGSRVEELLPLAREIQATHDGRLTRDVLKAGLAAKDETAGNATLSQLQARLRSGGET